MSFLIENWSLLAVALISGGMLMWPAIAGGGGGADALSTNDAVQLINREKAVVIDVCSAEEFKAGHVAGAKHLPLGDLESKLASTVKNKNTPVILVCASGMRSKRAVAIAKKLGFEKAHSLAGGLGAWRTASLPVEKA